ncbi:MAG: LysM peptidoglycan-binding domain-containing protein [Clostridia bacterium]|nr:LysM peptidoglycan-binding domain-containing protein [Clostridia bacterium]
MTTYKIRSGDTLSSIAKMYNTTVDAIASANGIQNKNVIYAGATLNIPSEEGDAGYITESNRLPLTGASREDVISGFFNDNSSGSSDKSEGGVDNNSQNGNGFPSIGNALGNQLSDNAIKKTPAQESLENKPSTTRTPAQALEKYREWEGRRPEGYSSPYTDDIRSLMSSLTGMDFSYDPETDIAYKLIRDEVRRNARLAMEDTLGKAFSKTGGYSNSYGQVAAQSAYADELSKSIEYIPELYSAAYDRYDSDRDAVEDSIELLTKLDSSEFEKYSELLKHYMDEGEMLLESYRLEDEEAFDRFLDYAELLDKVYRM